MDMLTRTDEKIEIASEQARKEGREEGESNGIAIAKMILDMSREGKSDAQIKSSLESHFGLSSQKAENYLKKFK